MGMFSCLLFMQKGLCTKKAEVHFYEFQKVSSKGIISRRRIDGRFTEDIEMDIKNGAYERINVPPILESRRSTVLHDFETVITPINRKTFMYLFVWSFETPSTMPVALAGITVETMQMLNDWFSYYFCLFVWLTGYSQTSEWVLMKIVWTGGPWPKEIWLDFGGYLDSGFSWKIDAPGFSENHTQASSLEPLIVNLEVFLPLRQLWLIGWLIRYLFVELDGNRWSWQPTLLRDATQQTSNQPTKELCWSSGEIWCKLWPKKCCDAVV